MFNLVNDEDDYDDEVVGRLLSLTFLQLETISVVGCCCCLLCSVVSFVSLHARAYIVKTTIRQQTDVQADRQTDRCLAACASSSSPVLDCYKYIVHTYICMLLCCNCSTNGH